MKDLKIFTENIEDKAREQIDLLMEQEAFKDCKIRIMPDVHAGSGCVIGFTGNLGDKVIPNVVGVDIGCGMFCINLGKVNIDLKRFDEIVHSIPSGRNIWDINDPYTFSLHKMFCYSELKNIDRLHRSMCTLGGGNHFIELDKDDEGNIYLVIHSGSRNLGKQVAEYYQKLAIENCSYKKEEQEEKKALIEEYTKTNRINEIEKGIKEITKKYRDKTKLPKELCYLEGVKAEMYLHDMETCQVFANINRKLIAHYITKEYFTIEHKMTIYSFEDFTSVHNYIDLKNNIVRKGAISAQKGERVIIPINMKDGCILGIGKGNEDWNYSAPHGAGRIMSRKAAKEQLNLEEFKESMKEVYSTTVNDSTLDEAPNAYKSINEIISKIKDTVEITKIIRPIYNFKASE